MQSDIKWANFSFFYQVVGQELLAAGQYQAAVTVLEAALRIGSCSLKLRYVVFRI